MTENKKAKDSDATQEPAQPPQPPSAPSATAAYQKQAQAIPADAKKPEPADAAAEEDKGEPAAPEGLIEELRDKLLRKAAEFDNYRKRVARERAGLEHRATESLMESLLPVLDSLELALASDSEQDEKAFKRGVLMIYKQLLEILARYGLEPIEAIGKQFDPNVHEAMLHEPAPGHEEGEVTEQLQRGYTLGGRVLRPARVKVASAPAGDEGSEGSGGGSGPRRIPIQ